MISLFAGSPSKGNAIHPEDEAKRARIQSVIDRAIEVPEVEIPEEMQAFFVRPEASDKAEAAANPWDVVREFVREEVREHAA